MLQLDFYAVVQEMSNVNYRDVVYENPPNVAEPPGHDIHTLSTEVLFGY